MMDFVSHLSEAFERINSQLSTLTINLSQKANREEYLEGRPVMTVIPTEDGVLEYVVPENLRDIQSTLVTVNGLIQIPNTDYSFVGDKLVMVTQPYGDITVGRFGTFHSTGADVSREEIVTLLGFEPAPIANAALTGTVTLNGYAIWDAGNFDPATKADIAAPNFTGIPTINSNVIWHEGNFDPDSKAGLSSPAFTGTPTIDGNNVWHEGNFDPDSKADIVSPAFTGTPTIDGNNVWHSGNFNPATKANLESPSFTGTANFANRPVFGSETPWDSGNFDPSNKADLNAPAFTGQVTFETRPIFSGETPWDSGNFDPSTKASLVSPAFTGAPTVNGFLLWHTGNFDPASKANVASPNFTGNATFANRPMFNGHVPWDSGNFEPSQKADLFSPAFTGTATFGNRPTFDGEIPWDSGNFTPSDYLQTNAQIPAGQIVGVLDPSNIPPIPSNPPIVSSGGLADLTQAQQDAIVEGTSVVTTDGKTYVYTGSGSKTDEASYVLTSSTFVDWDAVVNKPTAFPSTIPLVSGLTAALNEKASLGANVSFFGVTIAGAAATPRVVRFDTGSSPRWTVGANSTTESGGNVGSDFAINRYADNGSYIGNTLTIARNTGVVNFAFKPTIGGASIIPYTNQENTFTSVQKFKATGQPGLQILEPEELFGIRFGPRGGLSFKEDGVWSTENYANLKDALYSDREGTLPSLNISAIGSSTSPSLKFILDANTSWYLGGVVADGGLVLRGPDSTTNRVVFYRDDRILFRDRVTFSQPLTTTAITASGDITRGYTTIASNFLRYRSSANIANGSIEFNQVAAGHSGSLVFKDADGTRIGFIHADSQTVYINADGPNIRLGRRPTFGDNLAWDAGNFNPAEYARLDGAQFTNNFSLVRGNAYTTFAISANAGQNKHVLFQSGGANRWAIGSNSSAESGNHAGSNLEIRRYNDDGSLIGACLSIARNTGLLTVTDGIHQQLRIYSTGQPETLKLERSNNGANFIVFINTDGINRIGVQNNDALYFTQRNGTNREVYHAGNAGDLVKTSETGLGISGVGSYTASMTMQQAHDAPSGFTTTFGVGSAAAPISDRTGVIFKYGVRGGTSAQKGGYYLASPLPSAGAAPELYVGASPVETSAVTWSRVWTAANFDPASKFDRSTNTWITSADGKGRAYFNTSGRTFFKGAGIEFRNEEDTKIGAFEIDGSLHTGRVFAAGGVEINNTSPTIFLRDTNHRPAMIHVNDNKFHILRGKANNSTEWEVTGSGWPMVIDLNNNNIEINGDFAVQGDKWIRVHGNTGIYFQSWQGGWHMTDGTWLRAFNHKNIVTNGTIQMGAFNVTSDIRLKTDIVPLQGYSEILDRTNTWEFTKNGQRQYGVIAQEVREVAPILVSEGGDLHPEDGDPILAVDLTGYIPLLIEEIKSLRKRVADLENK